MFMWLLASLSFSKMDANVQLSNILPSIWVGQIDKIANIDFSIKEKKLYSKNYDLLFCVKIVPRKCMKKLYDLLLLLIVIDSVKS